jgi:RNA polymerase sigma-70 factor (ECF subfamily)
MDASTRALPDASDGELVQRVLAGERVEFAVLVRRYNQRMFRAVRAITHNDDEAEDVLQQTWLNVFRHLAQFRGDAAFSTWATRIAIHEALAQVRRRPLVVEVREQDEGATEDGPDAEVERAELGQLLERCLAQIPQGNREVLVLRDVLELDTAETATCLGLSEEAVRVRLHRARAAVASVLTERLAAEARAIYAFAGARCERITEVVMGQIVAM